MCGIQVSRICESLDDIVEDNQTRSLSDAPFPNVWVDVTYIKRRDSGHVFSYALVTAIGAEADGYQRHLGIDAEVAHGRDASFAS